jgi:carbonic anhydrase
MLVLGVPISVGAENAVFQLILDNIPSTGPTHNGNTGIHLNPSLFLPRHRSNFITYAGSLTTPPCSEGVNWYVILNPITLSSAQFAKLQGIYDNNRRDVQALNGRASVQAYRLWH